jgi:hypothetical protein
VNRSRGLSRPTVCLVTWHSSLPCSEWRASFSFEEIEWSPVTLQTNEAP